MSCSAGVGKWPKVAPNSSKLPKMIQKWPNIAQHDPK